jgi:hypothetical protein
MLSMPLANHVILAHQCIKSLVFVDANNQIFPQQKVRTYPLGVDHDKAHPLLGSQLSQQLL